MKVLIIEDESLSAQRLQKLIISYDPSITVIGIIASVRESVRYLQNPLNDQPDLIFLDIHLEDDLGFKIIEQQNLFIPIIFTTAFNEYMLRAFKTNSVDYLLKPIDPGELAGSLDKFRRLNEDKKTSGDLANLKALLSQQTAREAYKDRFMISAGPKLFSVKTSEIAYFLIEQKATFFKTYEGKHYAMDYSLDKLSVMLDPALFFRVNRSVLVSLDSISSIHAISASKLKLELAPSLKEEVYVSIDRISEFKNWLGR